MYLIIGWYPAINIFSLDNVCSVLGCVSSAVSGQHSNKTLPDNGNSDIAAKPTSKYKTVETLSSANNVSVSRTVGNNASTEGREITEVTGDKTTKQNTFLGVEIGSMNNAMTSIRKVKDYIKNEITEENKNIPHSMTPKEYFKTNHLRISDKKGTNLKLPIRLNPALDTKTNDIAVEMPNTSSFKVMAIDIIKRDAEVTIISTHPPIRTPSKKSTILWT